MVKFKRPIEIKLLIIPSNEKIFKVELSKEITEFKFWINFEKQIEVENKFSPICLMEEEIKEIK